MFCFVFALARLSPLMSASSQTIPISPARRQQIRLLQPVLAMEKDKLNKLSMQIAKETAELQTFSLEQKRIRNRRVMKEKIWHIMKEEREIVSLEQLSAAALPLQASDDERSLPDDSVDDQSLSRAWSEQYQLIERLLEQKQACTYIISSIHKELRRLNEASPTMALYTGPPPWNWGDEPEWRWDSELRVDARHPTAFTNPAARASNDIDFFHGKLQLQWSVPMAVSMKVFRYPFALGSLCIVRYAEDRNCAQLVVKQFHLQSVGELDRLLCEDRIQMLSISALLAREFNRRVQEAKARKQAPFIVRSLKFVPSWLCYQHSQSAAPFFFIAQPWVAGNVVNLVSADAPVVEAFAHFTYELSQGLLVVDGLQGIARSKSLVIVDSTVHCVGRCAENTKQLLANHTCSSVCAMLRLKHIR